MIRWGLSMARRNGDRRPARKPVAKPAFGIELVSMAATARSDCGWVGRPVSWPGGQALRDRGWNTAGSQPQPHWALWLPSGNRSRDGCVEVANVVDRAEGRRSLVTARVRTSVFLVGLAVAVLTASGCGTVGRSAATGVADSAAATSRAAPGSHPAAVTRAARATPSRASSPLTPTGAVTGCQFPPGPYRVPPRLHGGRVLLCSRSGSRSGRLGSVPLPG
jgi:hypothetical protein